MYLDRIALSGLLLSVLVRCFRCHAGSKFPVKTIKTDLLGEWLYLKVDCDETKQSKITHKKAIFQLSLTFAKFHFDKHGKRTKCIDKLTNPNNDNTKTKPQRQQARQIQ